jgi:hypothetical protein
MAGVAGRLAVLAVVGVVFASCATKVPPRPSGSAASAPEAVGHFEALTTHCAGLRTMTAELSLSGRAGDQRLRGRVLAGLERGGSLRLEGVAPFGAPLFILAARQERATLLLPRERRVLDDAPVAQVVERLTGLALSADDLLQVLAGCAGGGAATNGRTWPGGWEAVEAPGDRSLLMRRQNDGWQLVGVDAPGWHADYRAVQSGVPREVRLRSDDARVDFTATVQQLELNTSIDAAAFEVPIPADAEPMSLDELRSVAPLRTP